VSPLASTRVRAALALLALLGQLTPAVALPVFAAVTHDQRPASCACVVLTALAHSPCTPEANAEKRGCCGCCGTKTDTCVPPASVPNPDAPRVQSDDNCHCAKPAPTGASEHAVPAEVPVAARLKVEAEKHVPQSAPSAPPSLPAPPAPPPRA